MKNWIKRWFYKRQLKKKLAYLERYEKTLYEMAAEIPSKDAWDAVNHELKWLKPEIARLKASL